MSIKKNININLYTKENIDQAIWPDSKEGLFAKNYITPIIKQGTLAFIDNVDAEMQVLIFDKHVLPLIISNPAQKVKNSYVCSPLSHYIDYARSEIDLELKEQELLRKTSQILLNQLEPYLKKRQFESVVYVNNWLLSTNLYNYFDVNLLENIKDFLIAKFPNLPIVFRSINDNYNLDIYNKLKKLKFKPVFSRQVYILDPAKGIYKTKESYQKDLKLKRKSKGYQWEDASKIKVEDFPRMRFLYEDLYITKYSNLNPTFNENFFKETMEKNLLTYKVLKKEGQIYAVYGYVECNGFLTAPIFGYDTAVNPKDGLYRLTALQILDDAIVKGLIVHQSSGVSKFKMHRGAEASLEYNLVYFKHLPQRQQRPWQLFEKLTSLAIVPVMTKYKL